MNKITKMKIKLLYDRHGKEVSVSLEPIEFDRLMEQLEDLHDLYASYKVTSKPFKAIPFEQVKKELFGDDVHE